MNINNSIIKSIHNTNTKKEKNAFIDVQKKVTNIKV